MSGTMGATMSPEVPGKASTRREPELAEVVSVVNHELRQPLASIRGFTEMLLSHWDELAEAEKRQMLTEVLHDAKRVGRLLDELLDAARIGRGPLPMVQRPLALGPLLEQVVRNLTAVFPGLEAEVQVDPDLPEVVGDADRLEQVVANLVENAYKYGSPLGVKVSARAQDGPDGTCALVAVQDHGPGISPGDLPHVKKKQYRSTRSGAPGRGLGLWISEAIVQAHGGHLEVISPPGQGTRASFTIPLRPKAGTGKLAGT